MTEHDEALSRRYRDLAREEPPGSIDAAILAESRRAVPARARRHWPSALSIAAVIVLGIGLSLRMQREQPGIETPAPASERDVPPPAAPVTPAPPPAAPVPAEAGNASRAPARKTESAQKTAPVADAVTPAAPAATGADSTVAPSSPAMPAARVQSKTLRADPVVELERIARMRDEGRGAEADEALEEFRRIHPGYRIDDAMWQQVKPR